MTCDLILLRPVTLELQNAVSAVDGATIERRIRINRRDDGNARCKVSRASVQHKDFSPFTQPPTTRSTFNAISFQQGRTELFEPRPWTHGVRPLLQHEHDHQRDHSRLSFDNMTKPSAMAAAIATDARRDARTLSGSFIAVLPLGSWSVTAKQEISRRLRFAQHERR